MGEWPRGRKHAQVKKKKKEEDEVALWEDFMMEFHVGISFWLEKKS